MGIISNATNSLEIGTKSYRSSNNLIMMILYRDLTS